LFLFILRINAMFLFLGFLNHSFGISNSQYRAFKIQKFRHSIWYPGIKSKYKGFGVIYHAMKVSHSSIGWPFHYSFFLLLLIF
jgi:hypothetical protein